MCAEVIYIPGQSYERNPIITNRVRTEGHQQGRGDDNDGKRDFETQFVNATLGWTFQKQKIETSGVQKFH